MLMRRGGCPLPFLPCAVLPQRIAADPPALFVAWPNHPRHLSALITHGCVQLFVDRVPRAQDVAVILGDRLAACHRGIVLFSVDHMAMLLRGPRPGAPTQCYYRGWLSRLLCDIRQKEGQGRYTHGPRIRTTSAATSDAVRVPVAQAGLGERHRGHPYLCSLRPSRRCLATLAVFSGPP